jgi:hypothetical protein
MKWAIVAVGRGDPEGMASGVKDNSKLFGWSSHFDFGVVLKLK